MAENMLEDSRNRRRSAKAKFTRKFNEITKSIDEKKGMDIVKRLYMELNEAWVNVEAKHDNFCTYLNDEDCIKEEPWIEELQERFVLATEKQLSYEKNIKAMEDAAKYQQQQKDLEQREHSKLERDKEQMKIKRDMKETLFNQIKDDVNASLEKEYEDEAPHVMSGIFTKARKELNTAFSECKEANDKYMEYLQKQEDIAFEMAWMKTVQRRYNKITDELEKRIASSERRKQESCGIRMEKVKLPTFDGNLRNYARFKSDFQKQVQPNLSKDAAPYTLRSCLAKEPLNVVKSVDDDLEKMWERLDEKYADPAKITDVIINTIQNFKTIKENDNKKFIEFVNVIEDSYRDLVNLGLEKEITTTSSVSVIEKKLPPDIKREWAKLITSSSSAEKTNKFPSLLKFLINQKKAMEYDGADLRANTASSRPIVQTHFTTGKENNEEKTTKPAETNKPETVKSYRKCLLHGNCSHWTDECKAYLSKSISERMELLKDKKACWSCLKTGHSIRDCKKKKTCGENGCTLNHHKTLHEEKKGETVNEPQTKDRGVSTCKNLDFSESCILQYQNIKTHKGSLNVLWDNAASLCFVTFDKAKAEKLQGKDVELSIVTVGGKVEKLASKKYLLPLVDNEGITVNIVAYGIEKITSDIPDVNIDGIIQLFEGVNKEDISRPTGPVDVLIGYSYAGLHPQPEQKSEHLLLLKNQFGKCIGGSHPELAESNVQINHACVSTVSTVSIEDFYKIENLGIACSPQCGGCKCGKCPSGTKNCTLKEERELKLIERNLSFDDQNNVWTANYPWIKDPSNLPDNKSIAIKMLESTEKRLLKNPDHAKIYQEQIQDMISRNVARKLTAEEINSYDGPVHYIAHHEVLRPESKSTPVRIVFNSSANYNGHALNEYWAKGPDLLNNLLAVLLRFRENEIALMGDIKKMYHSVKIGLLDQHTHRFLWRDMQVHRDPDIYIIQSVSFGDKPSGTIASLALRKTAEMNQDKYPQAAKTITDNTYMDDIIDSVSNEDEAKNLTKDIEELVKKGGFNIKCWTTSRGCTSFNKEAAVIDPTSTTKEKVLGVLWDPVEDNLLFKVKLNFSSKRKGLRSEPDLKQEEIPQRVPTHLTKRTVLSQINGIYDPLGIAGPFTVKAKIMMRNLWVDSPKLDWDEPIPESCQSEWLKFFKDLFEMEHTTFKRCLKPPDVEGSPDLVIFSDASNSAFGACAYARWNILGGSYASSLIMSKNRLAPVKKMSIDRIELCGAVLNKRLKEFIEKESRLQFQRVYHIVDSQIVQAMIQKESYGYNTFAGTRVGEIQEGTEPKDWYWIESDLNVADYLTRGKSPSEIDENSVWQQGPEFLKEPENHWPVSQNCCDVQLEKTIMTTDVRSTDSLSARINIQRFSSYTRLIRVTARVLSMYKRKQGKASFKNAFKPLTPKDIEDAEVFWTKEAQKSIDINDKNLRRLCPAQRDDGVIIVKGRLENWVQMNYNQSEMVLLPYGHAFSRLYAAHVHNKGHYGVSATVSKIRAKYWIIGVHRLVKSIKYNCVTCKKLDRLLVKQQMGKLPIERLKPSPPWYYCGVDLFGPYNVRDEVKKRTTGKAYGVIFTCLSSRAVHVDLAPDYSTEKFLMVLRRFVSLRGYPKKLLSDNGPQLVAANEELKKVTQAWSWDELAEFGATEGLEWEFTPPDAPWRNGVTESLVKSVKKALTVAIANNVMTFSELQTVCFESANLVNERPIGRHPTSIEDGSYLCPNDLILGRCSSRVPSGPFRETRNPRLRFEFVQRVINAFWKHWTRDFFPSLTIRKKWHTAHRNVMVGDIVLIQDSNQIRGKWKLGNVTKVFPDDTGKVRKAEVTYKQEQRSPVTVLRAVQRLVVLVPSQEQDHQEDVDT